MSKLHCEKKKSVHGTTFWEGMVQTDVHTCRGPHTAARSRSKHDATCCHCPYLDKTQLKPTTPKHARVNTCAQVVWKTEVLPQSRCCLSHHTYVGALQVLPNVGQLPAHVVCHFRNLHYLVNELLLVLRNCHRTFCHSSCPIGLRTFFIKLLSQLPFFFLIQIWNSYT